jgi:hypothetical protein
LCCLHDFQVESHSALKVSQNSNNFFRFFAVASDTQVWPS